MTSPTADLHAELMAVVIRATSTGLQVLAQGDPACLPSGPLRDDQTSLQACVRAFAVEQTGHHLGFVEQLYTFADLGRAGSGPGGRGDRLISIGYLGLTRDVGRVSDWRAVYDLLPWEDQRDCAGTDLVAALHSELSHWAATAPDRTDRVEHLFGAERWRPELALQRYELLWEAGLVAESPAFAPDSPAFAPDSLVDAERTGPRMAWDHRRILATGLSRLRTKLEYTPVVAELMPAEFTLGQLQDVVESVVGQHVHKQNFRRSVQQSMLVEPTDRMSRDTGGRPAQVHRFTREVLEDRRQVGTKVPIHRTR